MGLRRLILAAALAVAPAAAAQPSAQAGSNATALLQVAQVAPSLPTVRVYFDARDEADRRAARPTPQQLRITVGRTPVAVQSVAAFNPADGIGYVFLIDVSRSLRPADFEQAQAAIARWIDAFGPKHQAAIVAFGSTVRVVQDFTGDKNTLRAAVDNLAPVDAETRLHEGLLRGAEMARRADPSLPARRAVVVLSDGLDDFPAGVTADEVRRDLEQNPVPLYALGVRPPGSDAAGLNTLGVFARASGGAFLRVDERSVSDAFGLVRERVGGVYVATGTCEACLADGSAQRLQLTVSTPDGRLVNDGLDVRFAPAADTSAAGAPRPDSTPAAASAEATSGRNTWMYLLLALGLAAGAFWWWRRRNASPAPVASAKPPAAAPAPPAPRPADDIAASLVREEAAPPQAAPAPPPVVVTHEPTPPPAPATVTLRLLPVRGGEAIRLDLSTDAVLGRSADRAAIVLSDPSVSGQHARLTNTPGGVVLEDLGSTNGTVVNGVPLAGPRRLDHGDVLRFGQTEFRVVWD